MTRTTDTYSGDAMGFTCLSCGAHMDIVEQHEDELSHFNTGIIWFILISALFIIIPIVIACRNMDRSPFSNTASSSTSATLDKSNILDPEEALGEDYGENEFIIEDEKGRKFAIPRPEGMRMLSYSKSGSSPEVHFEARGYTVTVSYSLDGDRYDDMESLASYGNGEIEKGRINDHRYVIRYDEYSNSTYTAIYEDIGASCALRISVNTTGGVVTKDFVKSLLIE